MYGRNRIAMITICCDLHCSPAPTSETEGEETGSLGDVNEA